MARQAEFRGGSELTTVDAYDAKAGIVLGSDKVQFAQHLGIDPYKEIDCQDALQPYGTKLPPPFQYASGLATSKIKRNATCLDYKARYKPGCSCSVKMPLVHPQVLLQGHLILSAHARLCL